MANQEVWEVFCSTEEQAEKMGTREAARRTRIGYPTRYIGAEPIRKVVDRETYRINSKGEVVDTEWIGLEEHGFFPILETKE